MKLSKVNQTVGQKDPFSQHLYAYRLGGTSTEMHDDMVQFLGSLILGGKDPLKCNCLIVNICPGFNNFILKDLVLFYFALSYS